MEIEYTTDSIGEALLIMLGLPQMLMAFVFIFFFGYYVFLGFLFMFGHYDSRREFYLDLIPGRMIYRGIKSRLEAMGK